MLVAEYPRIRVRDMSERIGVTNRVVHRILKELEDAGYLSHETIGRRNHYEVAQELPLRHEIGQDRQIGELLKLLSSSVR